MEAKGSGKDYWDSKRRSGYGGYGWQGGWKHGGGKPREKHPQRSPRDTANDAAQWRNLPY